MAIIRMKKRFYFTILLTLLASLVSGVLPAGQPAKVYAAPDLESLWSGSNAGSASITVTNTANANGSGTGTEAFASENAGRWARNAQDWTFTMDNSAVGTGTINSVTLYLTHYQSGWGGDTFTIDVYDGSTWTTVQTYTGATAPPTINTTTDFGTVAALDSWAKIDLAQVRIYGVAKVAGDDVVTWYVDTVELVVDYTPTLPPDISNDPISFGFGTLAEGGTYETTGGLTSAYFTVTNNSAFPVNITIGGTDMTGGITWTLSNDGTAGNMIYGLNAGLEGGSYSVVVPKTGSNTLKTSLAGGGGTQKWALQLLAPTTFTDGGAKSGTVTLTATQS